MKDALKKNDIVICTALIPGKHWEEPDKRQNSSEFR